MGWSTADIRRRLDEGGLAELANDLLLAGPGPRRTRLLLVVDQFEELLTQAAPGERAPFADLLAPALAGPVQMVATAPGPMLTTRISCSPSSTPAVRASMRMPPLDTQ
jgi:Novel STAND NTPase 1